MFATKTTITALALTAAGALATTGLGGAPAANASCASFFGIGNSADCTSTPTTIAIAIGTGATAHADGLFGAAFAVGNGASALTTLHTAFTFGIAAGQSANANVNSSLSIATAVGPKTEAETQRQGLNVALTVNPTNTSVSSSTLAGGTGNLAVNFLGSGNQVEATGDFNTAVTIGSKSTVVAAGLSTGSFNTAFSIFSTGGSVQAGKGPLAVAGSILQNGKTVDKQGPGFNINGIVVGGTAAVHPAGKSSAARKPASAGASRGSKK